MAVRISLGCQLSPLIGVLFLNAADAAAGRLQLFNYSLHKRHPHSGTNPMLEALGLEKHPDLSWLSFQSGRANRSQAEAQQLHREDISDLWATTRDIRPGLQKTHEAGN